MGKRLKTNAAGDLDTVPEDAPEAAEESSEDTGDDKGQVTVKYRDHVGQVVSRVFSKDVHGKDFKKLADEFKETNAARVVA